MNYDSIPSAKRIADARFNDVRNFATNLINDIHADVAKLPGSQAAVEKLINIGLEYLQKLNAEQSDNVAVVVDASIGYQRMGDLQSKFCIHCCSAGDCLERIAGVGDWLRTRTERPLELRCGRLAKSRRDLAAEPDAREVDEAILVRRCIRDGDPLLERVAAQLRIVDDHPLHVQILERLYNACERIGNGRKRP